ncbi:MAG: hypothetical protein WA294_11955 [Acidobacteriaceae bacterium]
MKFSFQFPATQASEGTRAIRRRSLLLAVVLIAVLPLAWRGPSCGQDFDFHLQSWLDVVRSWHQGTVYPRWAASPNYLAGEPRFVFYPPLSRLLGAGLGLVLPWAWTPLAFTLLTLLGAGFAFRAMAPEWAGEDNAALAACLYVLNPYLMFVAYERGALAELLAAIWLPLLVLYGLRRAPALVPLTLTVAALWLTNAPAAVMGCYMLAVVVAVAAVRERSWRLAARSLCAVPLGLGLAGFWLIPAIYEQRWVQIDRAIGPLMRVQDSFLFGYAKLADFPNSSDERFDVNYHNQVLHTASWIAVALMAAFVVAAWLSRRRKSSVWLPLVVAGGMICALQFRWSDIVWRWTPKLEFLQFPWRWMLVLALLFAALAGMALRPQPPTRRTIAVRALALLLLALATAAYSSKLFWQFCDEDDNVQAQLATRGSAGFEGTDEYTLEGVDVGASEDLNGDNGPAPAVAVVSTAHEGEPDTEPPAGKTIPATVQIVRWHTEHMTAMVTSPQAGFAVLRLMDYPAWRVTRNGEEVRGVVRRSDGTMAIPVAAGVSRIDVRWHTTPDQWAGYALSLAALAIMLACVFAERRRNSGPR